MWIGEQEHDTRFFPRGNGDQFLRGKCDAPGQIIELEQIWIAKIFAQHLNSAFLNAFICLAQQIRLLRNYVSQLSSLWLYRFDYKIDHLSANATRVWAGVDSILGAGKTRSQKLPVNLAATNTSGARFVRRRSSPCFVLIKPEVFPMRMYCVMNCIPTLTSF